MGIGGYVDCLEIFMGKFMVMKLEMRSVVNY